MPTLDSWTVTPLAGELIEALEGFHGKCSEAVQQAIELCCAALSEGHVCLELKAFAGQHLPDRVLPSLLEWRKQLFEHPAIGEPGSFTPLTLDKAHRLYLTRYWCYEQELAKKLLQLNQAPETLDEALAKETLNRLFADNTQNPDWQKAAAASALLQRLCIISGGPGTGKTTTVVKLLAALQTLHNGQLTIALAAPTGKAASRMSESIRERKPQLQLPQHLADSIPETASTLHRLLKRRQNSHYFKHNQDNPLPLDVLVVDEASMIDLAMMAKVVDALPAYARLILLGDQDQLDSVEAGAVFGQLCSLRRYDEAFTQRMKAITDIELKPDLTPLSNISSTINVLSHSFRFGQQPGIGKLAELSNAGKGKETLQVLRSDQYNDITLIEGSSQELRDRLLKRIDQGFASYWEAVKAKDPAAAFKAFGAFRVLSPHREGETGVEKLNARIEHRLARHHGIKPGGWYAGKPVMVTDNDYGLHLFNGDIGFFFEMDGVLKVVFEGEGQTLRWISPARLPRYTLAFAMTVHKSQGSEFDTVALILPEGKSALLSRNLIYTGITRAKKEVEIWGRASTLETAIETAPMRYSGLADALSDWSPDVVALNMSGL